jgi:hypothetical protein
MPFKSIILICPSGFAVSLPNWHIYPWETSFTELFFPQEQKMIFSAKHFLK